MGRAIERDASAFPTEFKKAVIRRLLHYPKISFTLAGSYAIPQLHLAAPNKNE